MGVSRRIHHEKRGETRVHDIVTVAINRDEFSCYTTLVVIDSTLLAIVGGCLHR